jgi:hypothetical protein
MMTRELALGMMRQADTGEQLLTVADAIVGLSEDLNIADAAAHFEQLQEQEAELDEVEVENDPMDDFNYVGSPHHY